MRDWRTRFWSKMSMDINMVRMDVETFCWEWKGLYDHDGYGKFRTKNSYIGAHRIAYELVRGKIPEGMELNHICRNRKCVNPNHLEVVTHQENMAKGIPRLCCKYGGHIFIPENTGYNKDGSRYCKVCHNKRGRERIARLKGVVI